MFAGCSLRDLLPCIIRGIGRFPMFARLPFGWYHVCCPVDRRSRKCLELNLKKITEGLSDALDFSHTIGVDSAKDSVPFERGGGRGVLGEVDFYTRLVE